MNLQTRAFEQLLRFNGEDVTFREKTVRALVQKYNEKTNNPPGNIEVSTRRGATIQMSRSVPEPEKDDIITDADGDKHTLNFVQKLPQCWHCEARVA